MQSASTQHGWGELGLSTANQVTLGLELELACMHAIEKCAMLTRVR